MAPVKGPLVWLVATVVACAAIGVAYLPPRGVTRDPRLPLSGLMTGAPTIERERANALAKEWRRAALAVRLTEWRAALAPELNRRRAADQPTLALSLDDSWPPAARERVARAFDHTWAALGLGTTKIGVAVVVEPERATPALPFRTSPTAYLPPDSLDRHTCVVLASPRAYQRTLYLEVSDRSTQALAGWTRTVLGPCAFYASLGKPSQTIEHWLGLRQVQHAVWDVGGPNPGWPWFGTDAWMRDPNGQRRWLYRTFPPGVLSCMSGRPRACRSAALSSVRVSDNDADLIGAHVLLSEMIREFGRARVARFWTSDLTVDSAFHVAMDTTLGDWVLSRQRAYGVTLAAGPAAPLGLNLISLSLAAVCLLLAVATGHRRQSS